MAFPINKVVSAGTLLKIGRIAGTGNTPKTYTLTATAAAAIGATSITVSSPLAVFIQHEDLLSFGTTNPSEAVLDVPDAEGLADGIQIPANTPTVLPVRPLAQAIVASATAQTYALRQLLGITTASPTEQPQTTDTTDMKSGFGQSNTVVGVNRMVSAQGFRVPGDRAMYEIVEPFLTNDDRIRELLWAELYLPNGDTRKGPVRITNSSGTNQVRNPLQYSVDLTFQGNLFQFVAGDKKIFDAAATGGTGGGTVTPPTFNTTITKNTTTGNGGITLGVDSAFTTLAFNILNPPTGVPTTMNLTIGGNIVGSVSYQSGYNGQNFNFYYVVGTNAQNTGTMYANKTFASGNVALA